MKNFVFMLFCGGMAFASYSLLDQLAPFHKVMDETRIPAALKNLKMPSTAINPFGDQQVKKKPLPLWACGCANMTEKESYRRGCTKGFVFKTMTSASEYAREKCGESCVPDCRAQNLDEENSAEM
jgi:hypothetical protein